MHHELYSDTNYIWTHFYPKSIEKGAKTPIAAPILAKTTTSIYTKKVPSVRKNQGNSRKKVATTYSPTTKCSTIGAVGLNFSVRDGKRWNPNAMIT